MRGLRSAGGERRDESPLSPCKDGSTWWSERAWAASDLTAGYHEKGHRKLVEPKQKLKTIPASSDQEYQHEIICDIGFAKALGESRHMNKRGMTRKYHTVSHVKARQNINASDTPKGVHFLHWKIRNCGGVSQNAIRYFCFLGFEPERRVISRGGRRVPNVRRETREREAQHEL